MKDEFNMTIQNAIQEIDRLVYAAMHEYNINREEDAYDEEVLSVAVWAMSKQIPMKPDRLDGFRCRSCSGKLARQTDLVRQKYCHHCGKKLDWEN